MARQSYPVRMPKSMHKALRASAKAEGASMNQIAVVAITETLAALNTAGYFEDSRKSVDPGSQLTWKNFDAF